MGLDLKNWKIGLLFNSCIMSFIQEKIFSVIKIFFFFLCKEKKKGTYFSCSCSINSMSKMSRKFVQVSRKEGSILIFQFMTGSFNA